MPFGDRVGWITDGTDEDNAIVRDGVFDFRSVPIVVNWVRNAEEMIRKGRITLDRCQDRRCTGGHDLACVPRHVPHPFG